jgi:hypothetical protein
MRNKITFWIEQLRFAVEHERKGVKVWVLICPSFHMQNKLDFNLFFFLIKNSYILWQTYNQNKKNS